MTNATDLVKAFFSQSCSNNFSNTCHISDWFVTHWLSNKVSMLLRCTRHDLKIGSKKLMVAYCFGDNYHLCLIKHCKKNM